MHLFYTLIIGLIGIFFAGCASTPPAKPALTSLEIQAFQKKTVEAPKNMAFAATMSVFQDLGYTIQSASLETGFITAQSPTQQSRSRDIDFWGSFGNMGYGNAPVYNVISTYTRATAFIESLGNEQASIRLNFVNSQENSSSYGQNSHSDEPILDATVYQNAFVKIEETLFIRKSLENTTPSLAH